MISSAPNGLILMFSSSGSGELQSYNQTVTMEQHHKLSMMSIVVPNSALESNVTCTVKLNSCKSFTRLMSAKFSCRIASN